jgi:NADPH-dependent curcumin reductase CurA
VYFENVGGRVFDAVMELVNDFARIPVCGRIAHYNQTSLPEGPDRLIPFMGKILIKRLSLRGFIQSDHLDRMPDFRRDMSEWVKAGKIKYQEDVVEGLENTVSAFQGLLQGRNRGKLLIQVAEDPTL